jgi:hypothetical protein
VRFRAPLQSNDAETNNNAGMIAHFIVGRNYLFQHYNENDMK